MAIGWLAGAFAPPVRGELRGFLIRSGVTWLAAAALGVLLRALALGRADVPVAFLAVTLGVGGASVLGWRLALALIARRR